MPGSIPLIRASAIAPFLRWMRANGRPVDTLLRGSGLAEFPVDDPDQPIPLLGLFRFARMAGEVEGPDLPSRVVTPDSLSDMGYIGSVALAGKTVLAALTAVMTAMPVHMTHGMITVRPASGFTVVREAWGMRLDHETRHYSQQYVAALVQALCNPDNASGPVFSYMGIIPHPVHGIAHLRPHFGGSVVAAQDRVLELHIPDHMVTRHIGSADRVLPAVRPLPDIALPSGNDAFISSARIIVAGLLAGTTPTVDQIALAAGQSVRTFQRRLTTKGTTFSQLVEDVRRERAIAELAAGHTSAGDIAASLGYRHQSSLTRAVRRWSGNTPRSVRPRMARRDDVS